VVSEFNGAVFPDNQNVIFLGFFPIENLESGMCGLGFPFGLFGLVVGNGTFLSTDHGTIINPANGVDHANDFGVVKYNTDILVPLIRIHWYLFMDISSSATIISSPFSPLKASISSTLHDK
jgi:hypothetical protein